MKNFKHTEQLSFIHVFFTKGVKKLFTTVNVQEKME